MRARQRPRAAAELGYNVLVVDDACATLTDRAHDEALLAHARVFGRVEYTAATIAELDTLLAKAPAKAQRGHES